MQQTHVMRGLLQEFCCQSWPRINFEKSKLHVSRNVDDNLALQLSQLSSIPLFNILGTYLDIPLFYGHVTQSPLMQVCGKLGSWGSWLMLQVGRRLLIKTRGGQWVGTAGLGRPGLGWDSWTSTLGQLVVLAVPGFVTFWNFFINF